MGKMELNTGKEGESKEKRQDKNGAFFERQRDKNSKTDRPVGCPW